MIGYSLARHRVDQTASVHRYIYLHPDAAGKRIQTYEKDVVRHGFVDGAHKINTGCVPGALLVYLLARDLYRVPLRDYLRILLKGNLFPFLEARGLHWLYTEVVQQRIQQFYFLPHDRCQHIARISQIIPRFNHLCFGQIEACLRFEHLSPGSLSLLEQTFVG